VTVSLREATRDERQRLDGLLAEYLFEFDERTGVYPELDTYWEDPERRPFLIEFDGEIVGLCLIQHRDGGWSIREFWVHPDQRRSGVGRAAVDVVAERGRTDGAAHLEAKVHPDNREALPFWLAVGFNEVKGPGTGVTITRRSL
jgi:predicted acetyltransferase